MKYRYLYKTCVIEYIHEINTSYHLVKSSFMPIIYWNCAKYVLSTFCKPDIMLTNSFEHKVHVRDYASHLVSHLNDPLSLDMFWITKKVFEILYIDSKIVNSIKLITIVDKYLQKLGTCVLNWTIIFHTRDLRKTGKQNEKRNRMLNWCVS